MRERAQPRQASPTQLCLDAAVQDDIGPTKIKQVRLWSPTP
jgi:hypothetical protein